MGSISNDWGSIGGFRPPSLAAGEPEGGCHAEAHPKMREGGRTAGELRRDSESGLSLLVVKDDVFLASMAAAADDDQADAPAIGVERAFPVAGGALLGLL